MRKVAHLSDLHFNRVNRHAAEALLSDLKNFEPDLVIVSGDLTQRAREDEFAAARAYLDRIRFPLLVVPGNHDIPLYDVVRRVTSPLGRFRRYITDDLHPAHIDDEVAFFGVNTARSLTLKGGRISRAKIAELRDRTCRLGKELLRAVVTHHPFIPPSDDPDSPRLGRADEALAALDSCGVELLLAGHLHLAYSGKAHLHHVAIRHNILVIQAGTAISTRRRAQPNAYNFITVERPHLSLSVRMWDGTTFREEKNEKLQTGGVWRKERRSGAGVL